MNNCVFFFLLWKKSNVESAFIFYKLSFKRRWGWQGHKAGARDLLDTYTSIPWWDRKKKNQTRKQAYVVYNGCQGGV